MVARCCVREVKPLNLGRLPGSKVDSGRPRPAERIETVMNRRSIFRTAAALVAVAAFAGPWSLAQAADEAPDVMIKRLSDEVLGIIRTDKAVQSGDINRIMQIVDSKVMPNVNFQRMTASAVGPKWRDATPEQQKRLQDEFKVLLVRTYAGALSQVSEEAVNMKPLRASPSDTEVVVRSEIRGRGEPIALEYRLEKTPTGWKIFNLNVLGVWLVETYRSQFAQEINAKGVDGLIATLAERNRSNAGKKG
jgi:phospholipid transport system substrate-binding protein